VVSYALHTCFWPWGRQLTYVSAICLSTLHAPSPPEPAILSTATPASTETAGINETAPPTRPCSISEVEEILRLNVCSHEFHAECLTSWFVFGKFSCPICREVYYGSGPEKEESGDVSTGVNGSDTTEQNARRREEV
jgi:hypothetical protein